MVIKYHDDLVGQQHENIIGYIYIYIYTYVSVCDLIGRMISC